MLYTSQPFFKYISDFSCSRSVGIWISDPSTARSLSPLKVGGLWDASVDKTNEWNNASNIPALSLFRCWTKAETEGVSFALGKRDMSSLLYDRPSIRSIVMIRTLKGIFLDRVKSVPGDFEYSDWSSARISRISNDFKTCGFIVHLLLMKNCCLIKRAASIGSDI